MVALDMGKADAAPETVILTTQDASPQHGGRRVWTALQPNLLAGGWQKLSEKAASLLPFGDGNDDGKPVTVRRAAVMWAPNMDRIACFLVGPRRSPLQKFTPKSPSLSPVVGYSTVLCAEG